MVNYVDDPVMFDTDYRRYVSQLEASQRIKKQDFEQPRSKVAPIYIINQLTLLHLLLRIRINTPDGLTTQLNHTFRSK